MFGTDVEILGKGADGASVGDATASLGIGFGFELSESGFANGERTAKATGVVVVREDDGAIGSHFDVALEVEIAFEGTVDEGFGGVFDSPIAASVANYVGLSI